MHQIIEFHVNGKAAAEADGNRFNKRKIFDH
jgi:hypothetical protein